MSMCRVFSWVVGRYLLWFMHSFGKTLLAFVLLHSVLQGQICLLCQVFLDFLLLHSSLLKWKGHLFWVLVLECLVGLHRAVQLLQHYWLGHRLGLLWYWMVCDCIQFFRLHPSTAFQTFVDYDGYSISSKGSLPTVVDIMIIWVKFTHSSPF